MSRRRRRTVGDPGSLELLLDTITNAFGGIVFLAILIVVLLQTTTDNVEAQPEVDQRDVTVVSLRLQDLEAEIERLELQVKVSDTIAAQLTDPELVAVLKELERQENVRNELRRQQAVISSQLTNLQQNTAEIEREHEELDSRLLRESQTIDRLKMELELERKRRTITSRFPEERSTSKREYNISLRYGRWYVDKLPNGKPNVEDFIIVDGGGRYVTLTPKPYRGKPLTSGKNLSRELLQEVSQRNPNTEYICLAIWDDSYKEFQPLRDYLVSHGFNYRLIPLTDGDEVIYGAVVDAKVQ